MGKTKYVDCWTYPKPVLDEKLKDIATEVSEATEAAEQATEAAQAAAEYATEAADTASNYNADLLAEGYDATATYVTGDYCIYDGALYRCIADITTPEVWTASHWTAVALGNDVTDLKSALSCIDNVKPYSFDITFETGTSNVTIDFKTRNGDKLIFFTDDDDFTGGYIIAYAPSDSTNYAIIRKNTEVTFTATVDSSRLRFYNGNATVAEYPATITIHCYSLAVNVLDKLSNLNFNGYLTKGKSYSTASAFTSDYPSNMFGDLPVNKVYLIAAASVNALDEPINNFVGTIITLSSFNSLQPGNVQIAIDSNNIFYHRYYVYNSQGNYWTSWKSGAVNEEEYHVGITRTYTSLTSLLIDLIGNNNKKVIYIDEGTYDIFAEYIDEINNERLTMPSDDITSSDYFYPYNAFVPNNTKIIGLGNVVLQFTPTVSQLEAITDDANKTGYGASRTWSPLNILGSVEIENLTVIGHNCRYCLHNDDHNAYPNSKQIYKNVKFLYALSDKNSNNQQLGFNMTIGFAIQKDSIHIFEGCEIYNDEPTNFTYPAFYGHESSVSKNGSLIVQNCLIHSSNFSNGNVIRLQSMATTQGKVKAYFENCYVNGGIELHMLNAQSPQNFDVSFNNCNKVPVSRRITSGGTIVDPYPVKWYNPLPTPTSGNPLIDTDSYTP